jgi:hypothetical protein
MRMLHYFSALAILVAPALLWTAVSGLLGSSSHVGIGLFSAVYTAAVHSLLILFMIVTGRVLKEAMAARPLGPEFLAELNAFFARKKAYPAALFAVLAIVVAAVLGFAHRGFGISPAWHWIAGILALVFNLAAITLEYRALRANQDLIDRVALELDRIDRQREPSRGGAEAREEVAYDPRRAARWGLIVAVSAWFPFLYWSLIVWKGHFARMSLHPWLELSLLASLFGLAVWRIARSEESASKASR